MEAWKGESYDLLSSCIMCVAIKLLLLLLLLTKLLLLTNAGMLLIIPLGTNLREILIGNQTYPFKIMHLQMTSAKWSPCLGLNVLSLMICPQILGLFGWNTWIAHK